MTLSHAALSLLVMSMAGCDQLEQNAQGLNGPLYNPCGHDVAPSECPGGKSLDSGESYGSGLFANVTGSKGVHWLEVSSLACTIELDSEGTAVSNDPCPDCALVLEMQHETIVDDCGVGPVVYSSLVGLAPADSGAGDYTVFISLYEGEWYAVGGAVVEDWTLQYDVPGMYDETYGYYSGAPNYSFMGEHTLTLNGMR